MPSPLHKLAIIGWWCPIRDAGAAVGQEGGSKKDEGNGNYKKTK